MNEPLVSVILPVYNSEKYIYDSLKSVLSQSYRNIEVILVNDGSNDNTKKIILNDFNDDRIFYFEQENSGIVCALNRGIFLAKGKYIARMDADDICLYERLEKQVAFLEKNSDYVLCGTSYVKFGFEESKVKCAESDDLIKSELFFRNAICHPSVMIRASSMSGFIFESSYIYAEDYRLWTRLASLGKFHNIQDYLLKYRVHEGQTSVIKKNAQTLAHLNVSHDYVLNFVKDINKDDLKKLIFPQDLLTLLKAYICLFRLFLFLPKKIAFLIPLKMYLGRKR
jgi:glycosyltransferase involved in cell wall biosynthesis